MRKVVRQILTWFGICWPHDWKSFPLSLWQRKAFALFTWQHRRQIHVLAFWLRNADNLKCTQCGKESLSTGQGYVAPHYFDDAYQANHADEIKSGFDLFWRVVT